MKANSEKTKQSKKATRRVLAGVLCGASVLSLVLSLIMPPISQAIANDAQTVPTEETVMGGGSSSESADVENTNNGDAENQNSDETKNGASEDNVAAGSTADGAEVKGAERPSDAQPSDNENSDENAIAPVSDDGYIEVNGDVAGRFTGGGTFRLTGYAYSNQQIAINKDTTIDLNGNMLCHGSGNKDSFFVVKEGATLTIEDSGKTSGKTIDKQSRVETTAGQPATMTWEKGDGSSSNGGAPKSLTYYETKSTPNTDGLCTTETTYKHDVTGFGAIVAASDRGSVQQVVTVEEGSTLDLKGGMITTAANLSDNGHVILSMGKVTIEGGYVTNGNRGGWGGGLCITGANASLEMTDGVVAGNKAASGGGVYADNGATLKLTGGIISGNATYSDSDGLGGGILVSGGSVTVSGGYITNNKYAKYCGKDGLGNHGGAGLAANNGAHVTISDGRITGNYSEEAGGGVYVTNIFRQDMAWLKITGGIIASNVSFRSEGAGIRVGQKVDAMIGDAPDNNGTPGSKVYITNNCCMSRFDWGGGGIFVQGDSHVAASNAGRLFVYNSYIGANTAGGYGGGVAVCPTGKTLVTYTYGTAIFGNTDAGNAGSYDSENNNGNPHLSGGGSNKYQDKVAYESIDKKTNEHVFRNSGHADFFLAAEGHTTPVAVVSGKMLGDIDARYSGSIELTDRITIPANGVAQVKNSIGLTSGVSATDKTATEAVQKNATTFIAGNHSWNHGGGIMSNGDLYLGQPADTYVYPSLKLKATKALKNKKTNENMTLDTNQFPFSFSVYRKDSDGASTPSWDGETFNSGGCKPVKSAPNNADGNITFDLSNDLSEQLFAYSKKFLASSTGESSTGKITYSYYLVEDAGSIPGVDYDHAVYEINVTVDYSKTVLMSVPIQGETDEFKNLNVYNYTIDSVDVTKNHEGSAVSLGSVSPTDDYYSIADSGGGSTFTNKYTPSVSWTPKATKVVEGGEMKAFTLQLAKDSKFKNIIGTAVTDGNDKGQTLSFKDVTDKNKTVELKYSLSDIRNNPDPGDSTGGPSKTFTYYVCEKNEGSTYPHYKFDQSVYKLTVVAKDDDAGITTKVTYTQIKDADGEPIDEAAPVEYNDGSDATKPTSIPTFTNTYSTSLPLSGMSGVTLTYLAGAAVLCAAAAWMHIRRKANAKGGERRE